MPPRPARSKPGQISKERFPPLSPSAERGGSRSQIYTAMPTSNEARAPYLIPRHVHLCTAGNQVIFLDLKHDKYFAISTAEQQALNGQVSGWPADTSDNHARHVTGSSESVIRSLIERGLLTADAHAGKQAAAPAIEPVSEVLVDDDFERRNSIDVVHLCKFLLACARARIALRVRSLQYAVESVRRRKARTLNGDAAFDIQKCRELVAIFDRLRPFFFTAKDACLFDSLALIEFLALHGCHPIWVIGVQTHPFAAHSWVQYNELSFNGPAEFQRRFTPILAV